jgi:putative inorganic carbon (HCO3(-)) transporter
MINACDVGLFMLYFFWMIDTYGFRNERFYWPKMILPAALFVGWTMTAIPFSIATSSVVIGFFLNLKAFLFFFYIINRITDKRRLRILFNYLLVVLALQGLISSLQKILHHSLGLAFLGEGQGTFYMDMTRVSSTFKLPNLFGAYVACMLPLSMSYFMFEKRISKKLLLSVITVLGIHGLFWSLSRSAWVGFLVGTMVMGIFAVRNISKNPRLFRTLFLVLVIVVVMVVIFYDVIVMRWETGVTMDNRIAMMSIAIRIIASNPVTGVGLFNYPYHSFSSFRLWRPVHNEYLRICAETGIPGLLFFILFLFLTMKSVSRGMRIKDRFMNMVAFGTLGGLTAFSILIIFGPEYQHYRLKLIVWIMAGIGIAILRIRRSDLHRNERMKEKSLRGIEERSP